MDRPITPPMQNLYHNLTVCRLKVPVRVRIVAQALAKEIRCPDLDRYHTLEAGHIVKVFDPQPMVLTGQNNPLSPEAYGYRIEAFLDFTVYTFLGSNVIRCERERFYHENLRPIELPVQEPDKENIGYPIGTIATVKNAFTFSNKTTVFRPGELIVLMSNAKTPKGQRYKSRDPIEKAVYDVRRAKVSKEALRVMNTANNRVLHSDLEVIS